MSVLEIEPIWSVLEEKLRKHSQSGSRAYKRLDLHREKGLRLGVACPGQVRELLIQLAAGEAEDFSFPSWAGMNFERVILDVPGPDTEHIRIFLESRAHKDIFTTVCTDIIDSLESLEGSANRIQELRECLDRWSSFFRRSGIRGLSLSAQQGLYGELVFLELLMELGAQPLPAVGSWKGCRRGYHDFEIGGVVMEVKTTASKEPRRIRISNERQLDDRGLESLLLFVVSLHHVESGPRTLPQAVSAIRERVSSDRSATSLFERSLRESGYLDLHESIYTRGYIIKQSELFEVRSGFPRIVELPQGTGDISYSVTLSACEAYNLDLEATLKALVGGG